MYSTKKTRQISKRGRWRAKQWAKRRRVFERLEDRRLLAVGPDNLIAGLGLTTYKLALATTVEFTEAVCTTSPGCDSSTSSDAEKRSATSAALSEIVADVNDIYQSELAISLELVPDNDLLISTGNPANDGYTDSSTAALYAENGPVIEQRLSGTTGPGQTNDYDLGHVLAVNAGGGLAQLKAVGQNGKANGVSSAFSPVFLQQDNTVTATSSLLGILLHEIGHQFGAEHSFNGRRGNCSFRSIESAYEPGSGSSIMAYQGICGADNLPVVSGDERFFHAGSFDEIHRFIRTEIPNLRTPVLNGNHLPTIDAGPDFAIPAGTPFTLTAIGNDIDSADNLTYTWDQIDLGANYELQTFDPLQVSGSPAVSGTPLSSLDLSFGESAFQAGDVVLIKGVRPDATIVDTVYVVGSGHTVGNLLGAINTAYNSASSDGATANILADGSIQVIANTPLVDYPHFSIELDTSGPPQRKRFDFFSPGVTVPISNASDHLGPLFRSFAATDDPSRTFPRLSDILAGTDPATNRGEHLPTQSRELNFRVTVRDNHDLGGQVVSGIASDDTRLNVVDTGAAFQITAPNTAVTWTSGASETVTWNVAGTDSNGIDTQSVNVRLSVDGGNSFPILLGHFANTGSASITVPFLDSSTSQARIKVEAAGNVFFDLSDQDFTINAGSGGSVQVLATDNATISSESAGTKTDQYQLALTSVPSGGGFVTITLTADAQTEISLTGLAGSFESAKTMVFNNTTPQTVFVRAIDDLAIEGTHLGQITHAITDTEDATNYPLSLSIPDVQVTIYDNDSALPAAGNGALVGVDFDPVSGSTPSNWTRVDVGTGASTPILTDLLDESGTNSPFDLLFVDPFGGGGSTPTSGTIPTHSNSLSGIDGVLYSGPFNGIVDPIEVIWSDLTPGIQYDVFSFALENFAGTFNQRVTIEGADAPIVFDQVTSNGTLLINDEVGSSARSLDSYAERVTASQYGTIRIHVAANTGGSGIVIPAFAIREFIPTTTITAINASDLNKNEGNGGTTAFTFNVTRSGNVSASATVDFVVTGRDGNPADASDFGGVLPSGQVQFLAGQTVSQTVSLNVTGDTAFEFDERFTVTLSNPSDGARLEARSAIGTIINEDPAIATISIALNPTAVGEDSGTDLVYTFTRNLNSGELVVNFDVSGTATFGTDYSQTGATTFSSSSGTVTFINGASSTQVAIEPLADANAEPDESVVLSLAAGAGYTGSSSDMIGKITGDITLQTIGLYQPDNSLFHLKESFTPGASDQYFAFGPGGNAGWTPLSGDWDGNGIDTIGLFQPDISLFHLKNTFTPGASDQYFAFGPGNAGWTPLVGDWNGDGIDTIGLYQPDASIFHLKNSFAPGASDIFFGFGPGGSAGWIPLTGDWNGDGIDTIGLYQPDLSLFHLKDSFTAGAADQYFAFGPGNAGWTPLAGDWNGDGVDTIGLYQPDISLFHLKDTFTPGASDQYFAFGPGGSAGWTPLVGDWNGAEFAPPPAGSGSGGSQPKPLARAVAEPDDSVAVSSLGLTDSQSQPLSTTEAKPLESNPLASSKSDGQVSAPKSSLSASELKLLDEVFADWA